MDISFIKFNPDKMPSILGIAAAVCIVYSSLSFSLINKKTNKFKEIPVPDSCYPYVGHLFSLGDLPSRQIAKWHKKYGPVITLKMGVQHWISIGDPFIAHELFVQNGVHSSDRPSSRFTDLYSHGGRGVGFSIGEKWKIGREATLSVFAPKMVNQNIESIEFEAIDLVKRLINDTEREGQINPSSYFHLATLNVILNLTLGKRYESLNDPELRELNRVVKLNVAFGGVDKDISNYLPILSFVDRFTGVEKAMKDHFDNSKDVLFTKLIEEAGQKEKMNMVKHLNEKFLNLDEKDKLVLFSDIIGGGQDTTETFLAWSTVLLCHHAKVQAKVQAEIDDFIRTSGRPPTYTDRDALPFCMSTLKECMRHRTPTTLGIPRSTTKDLVISGYLIPKGVTVVTPMDSLQFDKSVYEDPEKFMPERFMQNTKPMSSSANGKITERDHYAFGWGRRICPGVYMADVELFFMFVHILGRCTIEPIVDSNNNKIFPDIYKAENAGILIAPKPFKVKFTRRPNSLL